MPDEPELVAERIFFLDGDPDRGPAVVFQLWPPYQPSESYPRCRIEVTRDGETQSLEISGVDGVDCLVAGLSVAGSILTGLNESVFGGRLRWEGSPEDGNGLGLPTVEMVPR